MLVRTWKNICKGIAIAQAIIAPALVLIGLVIHSKKLFAVGVVWTCLVTLDTGRISCFAIDNYSKANDVPDDERLW